jgi:hypothetical protein
MTNCSFFVTLAADERQMQHPDFDAPDELPRLQNRLNAANFSSVRVNDFRVGIKSFITPGPRAAPGTKPFFH